MPIRITAFCKTSSKRAKIEVEVQSIDAVERSYLLPSPTELSLLSNPVSRIVPISRTYILTLLMRTILSRRSLYAYNCRSDVWNVFKTTKQTMGSGTEFFVVLSSSYIDIGPPRGLLKIADTLSGEIACTVVPARVESHQQVCRPTSDEARRPYLWRDTRRPRMQSSSFPRQIVYA